jgi:hypothetical protein
VLQFVMDGEPNQCRPMGFVVDSGEEKAAERKEGLNAKSRAAAMDRTRQPVGLLQIGEPSMAVSTGLADPGKRLAFEVPFNAATTHDERLKIRFESAQKTTAADMNKVGKWQYLDSDAKWVDYDDSTGVPVSKGTSQVRIALLVEADPPIDGGLNKKESFVFSIHLAKFGARTAPTTPIEFGFVVRDN